MLNPITEGTSDKPQLDGTLTPTEHHHESDSTAVERLTDRVIACSTRGETVTRYGPVVISVNPAAYNDAGIHTDVDDATGGVTHSSRPEQPRARGLAEIDKALDTILSRLRGPSDVHCVIQHTGQSGSGKTYMATYEVDYLISKTVNVNNAAATFSVAAVAAAGNDDYSHPRVLLGLGVRLVELFVNAKTNDNPNSSRFIKRVKLDFASGNLCHIGLAISGWERSRVVVPRKNESNYHVLEAAAAHLGLSSCYGSMAPTWSTSLTPSLSSSSSSSSSLSSSVFTSFWTRSAVLTLFNHFFEPHEVDDLWGQVEQVVLTASAINVGDVGIPARTSTREDAIVMYGRVLEIVLDRINNRLGSCVARFCPRNDESKVPEAHPTTSASVVVYDVPGFERVDMMGLDQFLFNLFSEAMYSGLADIVRYSAKSHPEGPIEFSSLHANGQIYSRFCEAIQESSRRNLEVRDLLSLLQEAGTVVDPEDDRIKLWLLRLAVDTEGTPRRGGEGGGGGGGAGASAAAAFIVEHQIGNVRYDSSSMIRDDRLALDPRDAFPSAAGRMRAHVRDWIVDIKAATPNDVLHVHSVVPRRRRRLLPLTSTLGFGSRSLSLSAERYDVLDQLQNANFGLLSRLFLPRDPPITTTPSRARFQPRQQTTRPSESRDEVGAEELEMSPLKPLFTKGRARKPFLVTSAASKAADGGSGGRGGGGGSIGLASQLARDIDILEKKRKDENEQSSVQIKRLRTELAAKKLVVERLTEAHDAERKRQSCRRSELRERANDADIRTIEWVREFLVRVRYGYDLCNHNDDDATTTTTTTATTTTATADSTHESATSTAAPMITIAATATGTVGRLRATLENDAERLHSTVRDILSPAMTWQVAVNRCSSPEQYEQHEYRLVGFADILNEAFAEICECGDIIHKLLPLHLLVDHWRRREDAAVSVGTGAGPDEIMTSERLLDIKEQIEVAVATRLKKELLETFDLHAATTHPKVLARTTAEAIRSIFRVCDALALPGGHDHDQQVMDPFSLIWSPVLEFLANIERRYDGRLDERVFGQELKGITAEYALETRAGGGFGDVFKHARSQE